MAGEKESKKKKVTKKRRAKSRKKVVNNVLQIVLLSGIICLIAYTVYTVARFVIKPSDVLIYN